MNFTLPRKIILVGDQNKSLYNLNKYLKKCLFLVENVNSKDINTKHYTFHISESERIEITNLGSFYLIVSITPLKTPVIVFKGIPLFNIEFTVTGIAKYIFVIGFRTINDLIAFAKDSNYVSLSILDFILIKHNKENPITFKINSVWCYSSNKCIVCSKKIDTYFAVDIFSTKIVDVGSTFVFNSKSSNDRVHNVYDKTYTSISSVTLDLLEIAGVPANLNNIVFKNYQLNLTIDNTGKQKIDVVEDSSNSFSINPPLFLWTLGGYPFNTKSVCKGEPLVKDVFTKSIQDIDYNSKTLVNQRRFYTDNSYKVKSPIYGSTNEFEVIDISGEIPINRASNLKFKVYDKFENTTCLYSYKERKYVHGETRPKYYTGRIYYSKTFYLEFIDKYNPVFTPYFSVTTERWLYEKSGYYNYDPYLEFDVQEVAGGLRFYFEDDIITLDSSGWIGYVKKRVWLGEYKEEWSYYTDPNSSVGRTYRGRTIAGYYCNLIPSFPEDLIHHHYVIELSLNDANSVCEYTFSKYFTHDNVGYNEYGQGIHTEWEYAHNPDNAQALYFPPLQNFTPLYLNDYGNRRTGNILTPIPYFTYLPGVHPVGSFTILSEFSWDVRTFFTTYSTYIELGRGSQKTTVNLPTGSTVISEISGVDIPPITYVNYTSIPFQFVSEILINTKFGDKSRPESILDNWGLQVYKFKGKTYILLIIKNKLINITDFIMNLVKKEFQKQKEVANNNEKRYYNIDIKDGFITCVEPNLTRPEYYLE